MALDFMILGLPRSGTTWAANFLTTDHSLCLHDPLFRYSLKQLDELSVPGKRLGISCTMAWAYTAWVQRSTCNKVWLYRPIEDIKASLARFSLPLPIHALRVSAYHDLGHILVRPWSDLFRPDTAQEIAEWCGVTFSAERHAELVAMRIGPRWDSVPMEREAVRRAIRRMEAL